MNLLIDARFVAFQNTGLGRFSYFVIMALIRASNSNFIVSLVLPVAKNELIEKIEDNVKDKNIQIIYTDIKPFTLKNLLFFGFFINKFSFDIYFHPHFDIPLGIKNDKFIVLFDLLVLVIDGYASRFKFFKIIYFKLQLLHAKYACKKIFVTSLSTKNDLSKFVNLRGADNPVIIDAGPTVKPDQARLPVRTFEQDFGRGYLLYVGDRRPHKNLIRIVNLYSLLRKAGYRGDLVMVGSTKNYSGADVMLDLPGIKVIGNVCDSILGGYYAACDAIVFLSLHEGFGLPVVEAAAFNKKMIVSDGGSLPEITPPWAYRLPNESPLSDHIDPILGYLKADFLIDNTKFMGRFNWDTVANNLIEVMCES